MLNSYGGASCTEKCNLAGLPPTVQDFSPYHGTCVNVEKLKPRAHWANGVSFWKRIKCFSSPYVGESLKHNNKRSLCRQGDHTIFMVSWFPKNSIFKMFSANCWNKIGFWNCSSVVLALPEAAFSDTKSNKTASNTIWNLRQILCLMYLPFNTQTDSQVVVDKPLLVWVFAISCCMRSRKDSVFGSNRRHTTCVELGWVAKRWKNCLDFGDIWSRPKWAQLHASVRQTWSKRTWPFDFERRGLVTWPGRKLSPMHWKRVPKRLASILLRPLPKKKTRTFSEPKISWVNTSLRKKIRSARKRRSRDWPDNWSSRLWCYENLLIQ